MTPTSPTGALAGLRVVDLSRVLAGPLCTQMLADHGAIVTKIEPPIGDETRTYGPPFVEGSAAYYYALNRNKQALGLDLTQPAAREVVFRLLESADVLVENFLVGTMEGWGLGYEAVLKERFPRLIYCRISGFGADGPLGGLPGYDAVLQAHCGLVSVNGHPDAGPTRVGIALVDMTTGHNAVIGILLALAERQRSGKGQFIEVTLHDSALSLQIPHAANYFASGNAPRLMGSGHPNIVPYDKYAATGGDIFLGIVNDGQFRKFCVALGRDDLATDPRFTTNAGRVQHREIVRAEIEKALAGRDADELCRTLMAAGVPAGPVNTVPQVLAHPHTAARGMLVEIGAYKGLGVPVRLSRTPGAARTAPPRFGEHVDEVMAGAGYSREEVADLEARGAVLRSPRKRG